MRGLVRAVDLVSFEVGNLETLAIVGESGSGKSSTAHAIIRILPRNVAVLNGSIVFDGVEIKQAGGGGVLGGGFGWAAYRWCFKAR
jgi:peptide/nickel transport system ATP-binding protein